VSALSDMAPHMNGAGTPGIKAAIVEPETPDEYSGPLIDLSLMKEALSRHRKFWIGAALAGLVIGSALHLFVPAKYAATADLYMAQPAGTDPAQAMQNDLSLLETRTVAAQALTSLHLKENAGTFLSTYQGTSLSNSILTVKLSAASPALAVAYDNAVAKGFLQVWSNEMELQTHLVVNGLQQQITTLNGEIKALTNAINSVSSQASSQTANQVATLVNERTNDQSQIVNLQSEQQQDVVGEQSTVAGSQLLDPAMAAQTSARKVIAIDGLSGLVAGLGLGMGIVIVGASISQRPRRRSEVAATMGVPVELSVGRYHPPFWLHQARLRRNLMRPGLAMRLIARRLGTHLDADPRSRLATIAIGPTEPAALGVASLAIGLASEGRRVVVVDASEGRPLAALFRAKRTPGSPQVVVFDGLWLTLIVAPEDPSEMMGPEMLGDELDDDDAVLVLGSVSPALGADHIATWADSAVVFVTAGKTTGALMASTAQLLRQAGVEPVSAVLVGAGQEDESVGLVSDQPLPPMQPTDSQKGSDEVWRMRSADLRKERQR
jgi:Mrp family chromosome partitioning ATPase